MPSDAATLQALVRSLSHENEHLKLLVAKLQRMQFGRRSEVLDAEDTQSSLFLDGTITPPVTPLPQKSSEEPVVVSRHADPCRHTSPGKWSCILSTPITAPTAVDNCDPLARTYPKYWNMFPRASK